MLERASNKFRIAKGISDGAMQVKRGIRAFTVIELMLAVAIMGVIIYALFTVFNQTQRALRRSETDVDVSQRARAVLELVGKEIEQAAPTFGFWMFQSGGARYTTNELNMVGGLEYPPKIQKVADRTDIEPRTNYLHNIFFYNNKTNAWQGIGYRVISVTNGVGVLQRYETNQYGYRPISNRLATAFMIEPLTNATYHHVADGVIHLTFVPYDADGKRIGWDTVNRMSGYHVARRYENGQLILSNVTVSADIGTGTTNINNTTAEVVESFSQRQDSQYTSTFNFRSNALPSYVEMELGMLEPETMEQYYTMLADQNPNATNFLARQISKVHLFRQRIPIRAAAQ